MPSRLSSGRPELLLLLPLLLLLLVLLVLVLLPRIECCGGRDDGSLFTCRNVIVIVTP